MDLSSGFGVHKEVIASIAPNLLEKWMTMASLLRGVGSPSSVAPQLTLLSGAFLVVVGLTTFGWLRIIYDGASVLIYGFPSLRFLVENAVLFAGVGMVFGSLLVMKFSSGVIRLPSRNLQIDLMFLVGSFLFIQGESLDGSYYGGPFQQIDAAYFFMFMGLGLFSASLFLWNNERRAGNRAGLRWEILITGSSSLIAIVLFPLGSNFWGPVFYPMLPEPLLLLLCISLIWMILGILGYRSARLKTRSVSEAAYITSKKPYGRARVSTALILSIVAFMVFLALPIFPYNNGCVHGVETALSPFFGFGCF